MKVATRLASSGIYEHNSESICARIGRTKACTCNSTNRDSKCSMSLGCMFYPWHRKVTGNNQDKCTNSDWQKEQSNTNRRVEIRLHFGFIPRKLRPSQNCQRAGRQLPSFWTRPVAPTYVFQLQSSLEASLRAIQPSAVRNLELGNSWSRNPWSWAQNWRRGTVTLM